MLVRSSKRGFAKAARSRLAIKGVARNRVIGTVKPRERAKPDVEQEGRAAPGNGGVTDEQLGSKDVIVAVIDTGLDGSHPDIAPNFNRALSRNWTTEQLPQQPGLADAVPRRHEPGLPGRHREGRLLQRRRGAGDARPL